MPTAGIGVTIGAFLLAFVGGALIGGIVSPELGVLAMPFLLIGALYFTWKSSVQTLALWVDEAGAVQSKRT